MAFQNTLGAEPETGAGAMGADGLSGVVRATGREAATRADERRQQNLIGANQRQQQNCRQPADHDAMALGLAVIFLMA